MILLGWNHEVACLKSRPKIHDSLFFLDSVSLSVGVLIVSRRDARSGAGRGIVISTLLIGRFDHC
jgi:hypothetical protein